MDSTMAMKEVPHLLTLPREVRDNVYSYIHHKVSRHYRDWRLQLKNALIVAVLLTHSQLYHEYQDADCYKDLDCVLLSSWCKDIERPKAIRADSKVFSQISHLDLGVGLESDPLEGEPGDALYSHPTEGSIGHKVTTEQSLKSSIPKPLRPMLPRLRTLRFRTWHHKNIRTEDISLDSAGYRSKPVPVPQTIHGLKMIQVANKCYLANDADKVGWHVILSEGYYLYANTTAKTTKANFWTLAEVEDGTVGTYLQGALEKFEKEREDIAAVLDAKVLGWTDQRMA
jgi:hypothetical protein